MLACAFMFSELTLWSCIVYSFFLAGEERFILGERKHRHTAGTQRKGPFTNQREESRNLNWAFA